MPKQLELEILPQPDDTSCGPTCLHAIYRYFDDHLPLEEVIQQAGALDTGGTLGVLLGCHALRRGYKVTIYTYNLSVFDPTWFEGRIVTAPQPPEPDQDKPTKKLKGRPCVDLIANLRAQMAVKHVPRLQIASEAYIEFLQLGGNIRMRDLNASLVREYLKRWQPILTGLSATYLYHAPREHGRNCIPDSIRGEPAGHFVVLCGYDKQRKTVRVADPYLPNPLAEDHYYEVELDRLVCAILLGVLTHDANLVMIEPRRKTHRGSQDGNEQQ